jgi:hypothetical protein
MGREEVYTWLFNRLPVIIGDKGYRCYKVNTDGCGNAIFTINVFDKDGKQLSNITRKGKMDQHDMVSVQINKMKVTIGADSGNIFK